MSEASETPQAEEQPIPVAAPPPARRSPLAALALLLSVVLAVAGAGGGWLLWQQLQRVESRQAQLVSSAELGQRLEQISAAEQAMRTELDSATTSAQAAEQRAQAASQAVTELVSAQQRLGEQLAGLDAQARANQSEWLRSEADFLARVALNRLRFHRDVEGALAALQLADQRLAQAGTPALPARQAVNQAVERLLAVRVVDVDELSGRIERLITRADILPLELQLHDAAAREDGPEQAAGQAEEGIGGRLQRAWDRFTDSLSELVIVQRNQKVEPLLAPEERYFLYHNLRLRLETARLALLQGDAALYRRSLSRASEWLERYYALGEPEVEAALAELAELRKVDIQPALPDLAQILEPVTR